MKVRLVQYGEQISTWEGEVTPETMLKLITILDEEEGYWY